MYKWTLKFIEEVRETGLAKTILIKNNVGGIILCNT